MIRLLRVVRSASVALLLTTLLIVILLRATQRQREQREAWLMRSCQSNIQFMFFAAGYYAELRGGRLGRLPQAERPGDGWYWVKPVLGMEVGVEGSPNFFGMAPMKITCPSMEADPSHYAAYQVEQGPLRGTSIHYMWNPWIAGRRLHGELSAAETILAYDCAPVHRGGRNCCFLDGHVKWLSERDFQQRLSKTPRPPGGRTDGRERKS